MTDLGLICFYVAKLQKLSDMTKPRLVKVRALLYVVQHIKKEAAPILTQPLRHAKGHLPQDEWSPFVLRQA